MFFKKLLATTGCLFIISAAIVVYAADESILDFFPAIVKAQAIVNPVGTWKGSGKSTYGSSGCEINNIGFEVTEGSISGTYIVEMTVTNSDVTCNGRGINQHMYNIPAVLTDNRLIFSLSYFSTWGTEPATTMFSIYSGELVVANNSAKFNVRTNYTQMDKTDNSNLFTMMGSGTLTRQ